MSRHNIVNIIDFKAKTERLYETGISKGHLPGLRGLDKLYSFKMGATTYIMASPTAGKTSLEFEILINLSQRYGIKHVICSPETGNHEEIIAELVNVYCRKPFYKDYSDTLRLEEKEMYAAINWLNEHFFILDPEDKDLGVREFYETVDEFEIKSKNKIGITLIDPFNELSHNFSEDGGRQDLYIERVLGDVRKNARTKERHNIIATHCKDQLSQKSEDGIWYYPPPTVRDYAGGQSWYRKGLGMIGMWRPAKGLKDKNGYPYQDNEVHVFIQKAKPKGIGHIGTAILFYDTKRARYYENINGRDVYALDIDHEGYPIEARFLIPPEKKESVKQTVGLQQSLDSNIGIYEAPPF